MMEMEADAAATASNEEDDGHLHEEGSDKGDMDSSQGRKDEEDPGTAPIPDEAAKNIAQSRGPLNDTETVAKDTANAIKCPNNGKESKEADVSYSKTCEESVETWSDSAKSVAKPLRMQPSAAATESEKLLLPPVSGSSQPVLPSSTAISLKYSSVPATLPKSYGETPTTSVKVFNSAAVDVTSSSSSDTACSATMMKTPESIPVSSSNTATSSLPISVITPSVTTTTTAVKSAISSSTVGCEVTSSLATKLSGDSTLPFFGLQQKASPSVELPSPTAMSGKPAEKSAAVVETLTSGPLPPKPSPIQPLTSPPSISPKPLPPKTPLIRSSVVSSSTSGKHIHKLPSPGNPTTTSLMTKNLSTSDSSASLSISSTSSVSSSSTSKPVCVPPTLSQVPSSKTVSVPNTPSLLPASKPVINPKFSSSGPINSGASSNPLPIKLSRSQFAFSSSGATPSTSFMPKQPISSPSLGSSIPSNRPVLVPKSSCPSHLSLGPSKTTPPLLPSSCTSSSVSSSRASSFSISHPNAPLRSNRTPLSRPSPPSLLPRSSQRPSIPCPSPSSSPRPSLSLQSPALQQQPHPIPTPPVSMTGSSPTQPVAMPPRSSSPLLPNPPQRPSLPSENSHLPATDFSVPDVRRDCPAGSALVTPPTSIVPDVLRTGSEEEDRQLERMLHPTPFGGGIPPPLMPDICRRGQDLPLVPTRIIRLPSGEADIDLLRPASAICHNRPNLNDMAEGVIEGRVESSNERLQDVAEAESDAGRGANNPSLLEEQNRRVTEPFHGALSQERTDETTPSGIGRSADSLDSNAAVDSDRVAPSSSKDGKDVVLASSSGAHSLPKEECFSNKGDFGKKEPSVTSTSNVISDSKETEIKTVTSLNPDVGASSPAEDSGSKCLEESHSEEETPSKSSGSSDKIFLPPKDDLNNDHKKLDSRVNRGVPPHCGDSSDDLKGERMTVERAELDKSSLAEEEESNPSLMLPPPVADLPADPAMEDGAKGGGGGEDEGGRKGAAGGDDESGGSSDRAAPSLPILDGVVASEKKVDVRVETAEEQGIRPTSGAASQAAQLEARLGCEDEDSANEKEDVSGKGEGRCAPPTSASGASEKEAPRSVKGGGKRKGTKAKEEVVAETKNGEADACGKVDALADLEGQTPENKKLSALGDLETGKSRKACDDNVKREVAPCELSEKKKSEGSERLEKSDKVLHVVDVVENKNSAPDAAKKSKVAEAADGESSERACAVQKEKDAVVEKTKVGSANTAGKSVPDAKVPEKDVGREKKELLGDVGTFNLANLSSSVSNDSENTTVPVKSCDEDLLLSEKNKIRDKHKEDKTGSKSEIAGVGKAEENSVVKQSTDQSSKNVSIEGNGEFVELPNETKGSHWIKSESLAMVAAKVNVTLSTCSKESFQAVVGSDAGSENPPKINVSISLGKSHTEKTSSSSQVQIGKDSSEKESVCSKTKSLDNNKAETRPQKPIVASGKSLNVEESSSSVAVESRRVDVSNKDQIDLTSVIESGKQVIYLEKVDRKGEGKEGTSLTKKVFPVSLEKCPGEGENIHTKSDDSILEKPSTVKIDSIKVAIEEPGENIDNSVLHKLHSNNVSHVCENVPAKLKKSADGVENNLGDDKPRLSATASKEPDLKQSSTEISACDGKYGTEKCLSGDTPLLKTPTQVFKVAIETINEDMNASQNETSKRVSNSVPTAPSVVQKPVAAVISSSKTSSGGQNKDQSTIPADPDCVASDSKIVLASTEKMRPETVDVSTLKVVSPPDSVQAETKTKDKVGEPNEASDVSVCSSSVMASVDKPISVSQSSGTTGKGKIISDVPLSKNDESCSEISTKKTDVVAATIELDCVAATTENKPDVEASAFMSGQDKVPKSNSKVSDCEEKKCIEERSPKDIPVVTAKETFGEKSGINRNNKTEVDDKGEKRPMSCKLHESDSKHITSPKVEIEVRGKEKDLSDDVISEKENVGDYSAMDSRNGSEGTPGVEKTVLEVKKVPENPVEDGKLFGCKADSPDDKAKSDNASEETTKDIKQNALLLNNTPSENNPGVDKNLNSKATLCKSENDDSVAHTATNSGDMKEKNVSAEIVYKEVGECLSKDLSAGVSDGRQSGEKPADNATKTSEQDESACKKTVLNYPQSPDLKKKPLPEFHDAESKDVMGSQKGSCDNSAQKLGKPASVQSNIHLLEASSLQTFIKEESSNNNETCITNTDSSHDNSIKLNVEVERSHEKLSQSILNQDKSALTKIDSITSQIGESKANVDKIEEKPLIDVKYLKLIDEKAPEKTHAIGTKSAKENISVENTPTDAVGAEDTSSEEGRLLGEPSKGKENEAELEDSCNEAVSKFEGAEKIETENKDLMEGNRALEGAEEIETENKDLMEGNRALEEAHIDDPSGKKAANMKEATMTEPVEFLSPNSESKERNEFPAESKFSECLFENRSEGTSKISPDATSPALPQSDNDSSDGAKFKKRGEVKQSREKSILGITEKLAVANQMRQQKQGESTPKESTSPRKMPGLIEMGIAKASRRKNLAVKEEAKIKKSKVVNTHESDDSGSSKPAPESVPGPIVETVIGKFETVPKPSTHSKEEVVKAEAQPETVFALDPTSSKNSAKEGDEVMTVSMQGTCSIMDLSSKKANVEQLTSIKDSTAKEIIVDGQSRLAENTVMILTAKESLDVKPTSEGSSEANASKVQPSTTENVDSPRKGEERKEEGGFRYPRVKRSTVKDKTSVEMPPQAVGPTTRTRAGFKQSPPTPPHKSALKQDDAKEKNHPKGTKITLKREEKTSELEPKRKNVEVSTEPFLKETEPKKSDALPFVEDVLSIRSSQSPISSSKLLEVIRVAGEKGRDVVKVNDVEVMREPVGSSSSPLSMLRKSATSAPVFSSFGVGAAQDQRKGSSPDAKNVSEGVQTEIVSAGSKFPPGNTESWEFVAKVGEVELLRESPRATPKATPSPLTITIESPVKKGKDKPEARKPGRPPSMPPPSKTMDYTMPSMNMLEQAFLAHQNFRNPALEVLVGISNRPEGSSFDLRGQVPPMGMQMGSPAINPWQMPNEDRGRAGCRTPGMDFTGGRPASTGELSSDGDMSSDKRKRGMKPRTVPPPKWSNQEADMLSVKVDGHPLGNWAPGDWRSLPPSPMSIWPSGFGYGLPVRPKGPMEPRCSRSVSPPSQSGRDNRGVEQMPEDLSSPPLPRGRRDSSHSFRSPFVHPAVSFPGGTPNFSNVSVMSYQSHTTKSGNALNLAKSTSSVTPPSDTAMNLTMCKQMSATPPPAPVLSSPIQSPRQSSLPVNLVKSRSSSPKGPVQTPPNFDGRGAVLPGGIVVPSLPLIFGRDYSMPTNTPSGRVSHCSAEDSRETETSVSQVRCSSEPPRDHLLDRTREGSSAFLATNFSQRAPPANVITNLSVSRATGNASPLDASGSRSASGEPNLLPGGVVIPNLFGANAGRPGEEQWSHETARADLPPRSASALSQYHTEEPSPKQVTPRLPTPVPPPPPPATSTPPPPVLPPKTGPGRRGGRSETPPPDKYNFRVEEAHVVRSSDLGPGGGQGGSKLFACDICSGVYRRAFSLKRHYLRAHINYCHLSERDLSNCGIVVGDKMAVHTGGSGRRPYVHTTLPRSSEKNTEEAEKGSSSGGGRRTLLRDLFRCHTCGVCFDEKRRLKAHLMEHQCGSNRPSLLRQHAATHSPPVLLPKAIPPPKQHPSSPTPVVFLCAYCDKRFSSAAVRRRHRKLHESSPGPHPCYLCETAEDLPETPLGDTPSFAHLEDLRSHMASIHKEVYHSCALCGERLPSILSLEEHAEGHRSRRRTADASDEDEDEEDAELSRAAAAPCGEGSATRENTTVSSAGQGEEEEFRYTCGVCQKMFTNYVNMCRHRRLAHGAAQAKAAGRKASGVVSGGKQGGGDSGSSSRSQSPVVVSQSGAGERGPSHRDLLDGEPSSSSSSSVPSPCPYPPSNAMSANDPETMFYTRLAGNIRDNLLNYLDGKLDRQDRRSKEGGDEAGYANGDESARLEPYLSWEKYNFPKDFQQMSFWDISTQLVVRNNIKKANSAPSVEHQSEQRPAFPETLALVETPKAPERDGDVKEEDAETTEEVTVEGEWSGLSGEWVRPRSYICCACASRFGDLWALEDHQLARHPNVWCTHLEVEDGAVVLPGSPKLSPGSANVAVSFLGDLLCRRPLGPRGALLAAPSVPPTVNNGMESPSAKCTKCSRLCPSLSDLHSHMLECGGDLAWAAWAGGNSPAASSRRNSRKWRPFGSRRRRQRGRRGMKRNIPSSPVKMHRARHRGTDSDSIQRMIANLPAKRATRRVIQFNEDEIKTRSQATIHNVSFPGNFVRVSGFKASQGVKPATPTAAKRGRPPKNPVPPPPQNLPVDGVHLTVTASPVLVSSPSSAASVGAASPPVVVKKGRGRPPGSKSKPNIAGLELPLKRRIGEASADSSNLEGDRYALVKRSRAGVSPSNQHQSSSTAANAPGEPYICKGCGAVFDNASSCERHGKKCVFRRQMPAVPSGEGMRVSSSGNHRPVHSCPHCGKNFTYATPMEKHVRACGGGSSAKGQPMHIRRSTAPGVLIRPPNGANRAGEEEDIKNVSEIPASSQEPIVPPVPKEPDMPRLQKEEPVASSLPKEEDIPVLTPVESDEGEDKKVSVEEEVVDKEAQVDFTVLQESDKSVTSGNDKLITSVEGEIDKVVEEDASVELLSETKVDIKNEIVNEPDTNDLELVTEDSLINSYEAIPYPKETLKEDAVVEKSKEGGMDEKESLESPEDKLFRSTGKRTRGISSTGQIAKKNKPEDEVVEELEEEEMQKKKPGRKSQVTPAKAKTPKSNKVSRGAKTEDEINTEEEGERETVPSVNTSLQEITTDNKREEISVETEEKPQQESCKSDADIEREASKIPAEEEKTKENVPTVEVKSKRGRKPKYPRPQATQETIAKTVQEKPDSDSVTSAKKKSVAAENVSPKLQEAPDVASDKNPKDNQTILVIPSLLTATQVHSETMKVLIKEEKEKDDTIAMHAVDADVNVKIAEETKLADQGASKSEEAAISEETAGHDASKVSKENEDAEDGDDEGSNDKDSKLRGTRGPRGRVNKTKKKKKKWHEVKKEVESFWCDVCQMGYSSAFNLVKHGMSQKHKWNFRLIKEKAEKSEQEKESKASVGEVEEGKKLEGNSSEMELGESSTKEQKKLDGEKTGENNSEEEKDVDEQGKAIGDEMTGVEKVLDEGKDAEEKEDKGEDNVPIDVTVSEMVGAEEAVDEKSKEEMVVESNTEIVQEKSPDSAKSKEIETADAVRPASDSSDNKGGVSENENKEGVLDYKESLEEEVMKKEDSSIASVIAEEPACNADTSVNVTDSATNADDTKSSLPKDKTDIELVSEDSSENEKSNQAGKGDADRARVSEEDGSATKVSPEAVVAAAPESATVIEGNKSTPEGVQRGTWQEATAAPPPSQEFLQPPIPPPASYNPLYEWDTNLVQPAPLQAQPGGPQHLHQTQQQDGWGAYGGWEASNADPNPLPSPGLWRYQPPTPIPWGEPQHSLSPIPRVSSYTEDTLPVTHPSPPNPSLGSILDSVNRILGEDGSGFDSTRMHAATAPEEEYGGVGLFGESGLAELQRAMGATDEEMAMLQQLGTGPLDFVYDNNAGISSVTDGSTEAQDQTGPLPNAELVDLDNQAAAVTMVEEGPIEETETAVLPPIAVETSNVLVTDGRGSKRKRCGPLPSKCKRLPPPNREGGRGWRGGRRPALAHASLASAHLFISQYEKKEMVCPVCNRHFLGLAALETHVAWVHKMKDAKQHILEGETAGHPSGSESISMDRNQSLPQSEKTTPTASNSLRELVAGRAGTGGVVVGGGGAAPSPTPSRRLPCFVCKELYSDVISLNHHIAQQHLRRRPGEGGVVPEMDGDLKSQMTSALGGLLGKALANMRSRSDTSSSNSRPGGLSTTNKSPHLSFPKLNLLSKPLEKGSPTAENASRKSFGGPSGCDGSAESLSRAEPSSDSPEVTLFRREDGVDPSEWSSDGEDSPKVHEIEVHDEGVIPSFHHICPFCGDRFQKLSSRNRHISVAHRDPTCIDMMRMSRNISHESSDFDDLLSRSRKDDSDGILVKEEPSEETQETGRRHNHHPCPACQLSFLRHSQLEAHLKRAHNGSDSQLQDTSDSMMECPICRESMNHFLKLCKHVKAKHREWSINCFTTDMHHHLILRKESPEESMVIRKKFLVKMKAFPVLRMASPTPSSKSSEEESYMDPDPKGNYLCSVCGVNFKSPQGVIRHLNLEHNSNHLEGALPMQKIFPRHPSKEYRGRPGGGSGSDIKAKAEAALRELNLSQKLKLGAMAAAKGMVPAKGAGSRKSEGGGGEVQGGATQTRGGGGRGRGSNRRGRGRRGGRVAASSDVEKSLFDVYEFEDDEEEAEEAGSRVGSADGGSSRMDSECGGDDEEEEEEGGTGEEEGKGSSAASIRAKRASVDSVSSEVKYSCNSCGKGYKSLTAFWKHTKGVRGACAGGSCSPRSGDRGQEVVLRGCKVSGKKGYKEEEGEGSDAEGEAGGRVLRRLRGSTGESPAAVVADGAEAGQSSETEAPKKVEKGSRKGKKKGEEEKKPVFSGGETVRTYGGKRWVKQQQQVEEKKGRGSEEGAGGRRSQGASEAAFDALRGGGGS